MTKWVDYAFAGVIVLIAIVVGWMIVMGVIQARADVECKRLGWREADVTWQGTAWCQKRVEQTDSVRALRDLRRVTVR